MYKSLRAFTCLYNIHTKSDFVYFFYCFLNTFICLWYVQIKQLFVTCLVGFYLFSTFSLFCLLFSCMCAFSLFYFSHLFSLFLPQFFSYTKRKIFLCCFIVKICSLSLYCFSLILWSLLYFCYFCFFPLHVFCFFLSCSISLTNLGSHGKH